MPQLFLFCIGGTGARVLKSLLFLLASGIDIKARTIIPILIDPDASNGDVEMVTEILQNYQSIRQKTEPEKEGFFATNIQSLGSLATDTNAGSSSSFGISKSFKWDIDGTREGLFRRFISYDTMEPIDQSMTNLLFSEQNLNAELAVGFKGNPHMGSVVLNQIKNSKEFQFFASRFNENDRVFVVSSIFGGTGAAGFPLLIKNIREADETLSSHQRLVNAPIGAITVTPYFGIEPDKSIAIDKNTFIAKTKAALEYYDKNLSGNNSINALYYIGDTISRDYKPAEGKREQRNDAHVVELISSLAIIDFMNIDNTQLSTIEGKAETPIYKEYGIINGKDRQLNFRNLGATSRSQIAKNLTQYAYALNYWKNHLKTAIDKPANWARSKKVPFSHDFMQSSFFTQHFTAFNNRFQGWFMEMSTNERGFRPFDLMTNSPSTLVLSYEQMKKNLLGQSVPDRWDYSYFDAQLDEVEKKLQDYNPEKRFLALFYYATQAIINDKLKELTK